MKTAITELIEGVKERLTRLNIIMNNENESLKMRSRVEIKYFELLSTLEALTKALPKEREQIEEAYYEGGDDYYSNGQGSFSTSSKEYFTKTYEQ
mgnify:CR=1 FL=1